MNRSNITGVLSAIGLSLTLAACDSGTHPPAAPAYDVQTGVFDDALVTGLPYDTSSQSSSTNGSGTYFYITGEIITFSIGDTQLGTPIEAKSVITPEDLVPSLPSITTIADVQQAQNTQAGREAINRFANILVLLQSLDDDKDPSNGIVIPEGVLALLDGVTLDLNLDTEEFAEQTALRLALHQAADMGLISSAAVVGVETALDHYFSSQGISLDIVALETLSFDSDADGTVDQITTFTYDADGNLIEEGYDYDLDGVAEDVTTYTTEVDEMSGEVTETETFDAGDDGTPDAIYIEVYDANGNLLTLSEDGNGDGTPEYLYSATYDVNGNLLSETWDQFGDGSDVDVYTYAYDTDGNRVSESWDWGDDGVVDIIKSNTYDEDGNWVTESFDWDADGVADEIHSFTYDANGNLSAADYDYNADGTPDDSFAYTHDANGNLLTFSVDEDADDSIDVVLSFTYDANGNLLTLSQDQGADGTNEAVITNTYDSNGNLTSSVWVSGGAVQEAYSLSYDANGSLTGIESDFDGDDVLDYIVAVTNDADGNPLTVEIDEDGDGTADEIYTATYISANWTSAFATEGLGDLIDLDVLPELFLPGPGVNPPN